MKHMLLTFTGTCLIGGLAVYFGQKHQQPGAAPRAASTTAPIPEETAQPAASIVFEEGTQPVAAKTGESRIVPKRDPEHPTPGF